MPLRKADSIFQADTGRVAGFDSVDFILTRLVHFGKMEARQTPHTDTVRETLLFLLEWNSKLPRPFDPWFLFVQTWHETGGYTSSYFIEDGNLAGIGIWASGVPSPWNGKLRPELAAKVYLLELMAHTLTEAEYDSFMESDVGEAFNEASRADNTHLVKLWNLRHSVNWPTVRRIDQLNDSVPPNNFVWAADPLYPDKLERLAGEVAPNIPDTKGNALAVNIGNRPLRIAIGAGHRNTDGGNAWEAALNAKCTHEVVKLARQSRGFEIRSYSPEDGLGYSNIGLAETAAIVTGWLRAGWPADILHELHHEGTHPSIRGGFWIYPDSAGLIGRNAGNRDGDVAAEAGAMARILVAEFGGLTRYGNPGRGMSEKETGVGGKGFRLGVFGAWAEPYFNDNSFVMLSEAAAYTNPSDLAIMSRPEFPRLQAIGILKAYAHLAKARGNWTYPYSIGEGAVEPKPVPVKNPAPDGLAYPAGFDNGIMEIAFGTLTDGSRRFRFNPAGTISRKWYTRFKDSKEWPRLTWHFEDATGREYFGFSSGHILWRPSRKDAWRWA